MIGLYRTFLVVWLIAAISLIPFMEDVNAQGGTSVSTPGEGALRGDRPVEAFGGDRPVGGTGRNSLSPTVPSSGGSGQALPYSSGRSYLGEGGNPGFEDGTGIIFNNSLNLLGLNIHKSELTIDEHIYIIIFVVFMYLILSLLVSANYRDTMISVPRKSAIGSFVSSPLSKSAPISAILVPLLIYLMKIKVFNLEFPIPVPLNMKLAYFSAVSLSLVSIIYAITYRDSPEERPSQLIIDWLCYIFLIYGFLLLILIFYRTSIFVLFS